MESTHTGWWKRHGWTVAILLAAFGSAFAIRTIWTYPIVAQYGALYTYAGGSDSYYHSRVMADIILTHSNLIHDPLLKYPTGAINPREPLFDWMNAILGIIFAPFFGGSAVGAGAWFLDLDGPLWAALSIFPIYLIGREISDRRMGLIAAMIYPFLSASIDSSIFGYANYLSFYTCIILVTVYAWIRTVKAVGSRRWVESYRHPSQYWPALRAFLRTERSAVKWAVFTGVSLGALALSWQGYTYAVVVIGLGVLISMVAERIRHVDSFGLYVAAWITGGIGFGMEFPYYFVQYGGVTPGFVAFFVIPAVVLFGILLLLLPFLLMRDVPWVFSLPFLAGIVLAGVAALAVFDPNDFTTIVTGQGYFIKSLIYSTVAEAQAPSIDQLIIGYGVVTFFLAFVGVALFVYVLIRGRFKRQHVAFLVFAILSIYLPITATKFFLVASPAFALLPAEAIYRALRIGRYPELRRTVASLSDRRSQFAAFRKAFKPRHVLVMALVVLIILPNVWVSIDAGIPGNTKTQFGEQVGATLPTWLQLNTSNPGQYYFGAAGTSLDTPNQYDSAGYNWLATQDTNIPPADRPALISWWDYGFQTIDQGQHPSVADNFQNGIDPSGQFLLSQNESQAIAVLTITLLQGEQRASGEPYLPPALNRILAYDGLNLATLHNLMVNTSADLPLVINNPQKYLPVNPSTITADNAMYLATEVYIASALPLAGVAQVYDNVQQYTGWSIRYVLADSRLFPFSGTDTGIYYAPADLTGRVINAAGEPTTFFNVTVLGSDGNTYPIGQLPADVSAVNYNINYFAPFYNSMIYRTYIGYNGTDIGLGSGIPCLTLNCSSAPLEPGWMLQHFQIVYMTSYYCPAHNAPSGSSCFSATNKPTALALAKADNGTADTSAASYFSGGETMLEYFPGQPLVGSVVTSDGTPVPGAHVTVDDSWGIPHDSVVTGADGSFSVVLPPGNDTVNVTMGTFDQLKQQGNIILKSVPIDVPEAVGMSFNAPSRMMNVVLPGATVGGSVYWNIANNTTYSLGDINVPGAQVVLWGTGGLSKLTATTDVSGTFALSNVPPGVYNMSVLYQGANFTEASVYAEPGNFSNATAGLTPASITGLLSEPGGATSTAAVAVVNSYGLAISNVSNSSGYYHLTGLGPGNWTLSASIPGTDLRSPGLQFNISKPGTKLSFNLTLAPSVAVTVTAVANGAPAGGVPVRFSVLSSYLNSSISPIGVLSAASANTTVVTTDPSGVATVYLPAGNYSVYALGYVGSTLYAGTTELTALPAVGPSSAVLTLSPAIRLTGTVSGGASLGNTTRTAVIAYSNSATEVTAWAMANGTYSFLLPRGNYSLLALRSASSGTGAVYAALGGVVLTAPSQVPLTLSSAVVARFTVGAALPSGAFFPAAAAQVSISQGTGGASVPVVASSSGQVALYLPSSLPLSSPTYCVSAQSIGFSTASDCGLTPSSLVALSQLPLQLLPVSVTLRVVGLPLGVPVTVNLTAESETAQNRTLNGGPVFSFSQAPGVYGVGARATLSSGKVVYLPSSILQTTIPIGATTTALTLGLIAQINATGTLSVPSGVNVSRVNISLSSPFLNVSVNGTNYTHGFRVAPGTYSAYASLNLNGTLYTDLSRVTVGSNGTIFPTLVLNTLAVKVQGSLNSPSHTLLETNLNLTLTAPSGASTTVETTQGAWVVDLPPNTNYSVRASSYSTISGPNGTYQAYWTTNASASCLVGPGPTDCNLTLYPTTISVPVTLTLNATGIPGLQPGSVRIVGPYPFANVTVLSTTNGTVVSEVLPGAYSVYATGGGASSPLAGFGSFVALPSRSGPFAISLVPAWIDAVRILTPIGTSTGLSPANLTVRNAVGTTVTFTNVSEGPVVDLALPVGRYTISASAIGRPYGVATEATARENATLVSGNLATNLQLVYRFHPSVTGTVLGSSTVTVSAGGVATFSYSVRNTGNEPVVVHAVGSPAFWGFNFSAGNLSLGVGTGPVGETVTIHVPAGTAVTHSPVAISFENSTNAVVGSVTPAPVVRVLGYYGISVGTSPSLPAEIGNDRARALFYATDTGNQPESVVFSVVNAGLLSSYGWKTQIAENGKNLSKPLYLQPSGNSTLTVYVNASSSIFVPPQYVTVAASVLNASGAASGSVTISLAMISVNTTSTNGSAPITITGPSIGTPPNVLPDWLIALLAFVPTIALIALVLLYRWNRTRRWSRR